MKTIQKSSCFLIVSITLPFRNLFVRDNFLKGHCQSENPFFVRKVFSGLTSFLSRFGMVHRILFFASDCFSVKVCGCDLCFFFGLKSIVSTSFIFLLSNCRWADADWHVTQKVSFLRNLLSCHKLHILFLNVQLGLFFISVSRRPHTLYAQSLCAYRILLLSINFSESM